MTTRRFDVLSTSDSGMHYVREKKSGVLRRLTPGEVADFEDPPPCAECGEQFGCEHRNCAGEVILDEAEIDVLVPVAWRGVARTIGVSREDVARLQSLAEHEGIYKAVPGADMRTLELVLLLNGEP